MKEHPPQQKKSAEIFKKKDVSRLERRVNSPEHIEQDLKLRNEYSGENVLRERIASVLDRMNLDALKKAAPEAVLAAAQQELSVVQKSLTRSSDAADESEFAKAQNALDYLGLFSDANWKPFAPYEKRSQKTGAVIDIDAGKNIFPKSIKIESPLKLARFEITKARARRKKNPAPSKVIDITTKKYASEQPTVPEARTIPEKRKATPEEWRQSAKKEMRDLVRAGDGKLPGPLGLGWRSHEEKNEFETRLAIAARIHCYAFVDKELFAALNDRTKPGKSDAAFEKIIEDSLQAFCTEFTEEAEKEMKMTDEKEKEKFSNFIQEGVRHQLFSVNPRTGDRFVFIGPYFQTGGPVGIVQDTIYEAIRALPSVIDASPNGTKKYFGALAYAQSLRTYLWRKPSE